MYSHCLCRLSRRVSLSNAQLLLNNSGAPPGYPRSSPDAWRSLLPHEHYSTSPHPEAAPVTRTARAPHDTNWCNKLVESCQDANAGQPRGSFRVAAPIATIGVAEIAAAFALASLGPMHTPTITEPPSAVFPLSIQSPSWATPSMVLDDALVKVFPTQSAAPPAAPDNAAAAPAAAAAAATPFLNTTPSSVDLNPVIAPAPEDSLDSALPAVAAAADLDLVPYTAVKPSNPAFELKSPATSGDAVAFAAAAVDYLPAALRPLVPASVADYWAGVRAAMREGLLHATLYVSPKAWPQVAPTITGMLGATGAGPAGQVRFSLVPLGADYATRAAAAAAAAAAITAARRTQGGGSATAAVYDNDDGGAGGGDRLAALFGLDVALAAAALAAPPGGVLGGGGGDGGRGRGARPLEACPAMVVRGGYTGSARAAGGEASPAWSMRQDLDEHVRRNMQYTQRQQQQQPQQQEEAEGQQQQQ